MANVTRTTKRIIDPSSGLVVEVEIEIDRNTEVAVRRFQTASDIQRRMEINLDAAACALAGAGKRSGSMRKSMRAQEFVGCISNKAIRQRRHNANATRIKRENVVAA